MKKTIFGSALMICGMIAGCTEYLSHQILFAAPDVAKIGVNYLLHYGGPILFIAGLVFCIAGLTERVVVTPSRHTCTGVKPGCGVAV